LLIHLANIGLSLGDPKICQLKVAFNKLKSPISSWFRARKCHLGLFSALKGLFFEMVDKKLLERRGLTRPWF
jgi:hypothetical protein